MDIRFFPAPDVFGDVVCAVYDRDPVFFTLERTTLRARDWPAGQMLLSAEEGGGVVGAAVQSADGALLVNGVFSDWAREVMSAVASGIHHPVTGVRGMPLVAAAFAQAWGEIAGVLTIAAHEEVLYRLDAQTPPVGVSGACRPAGAGDSDLLVEWLDGFFAEAFGFQSAPDAHRNFLHEVFTSGDCILLWAVSGAPVSMARIHAPAAGVSRIGPVYTPPQHRGHGFAAAVTSHAADWAHEHEATDVVLFADVHNLASNRVYRRIGFRPFSEHVHYEQRI